MFDHELAFAHALADAACEISMRFFRGSFEIREKADNTPVTEADLAVEATIRERIHARFPNDGITGEEGGVEGGGARRWIIDPVDGTRNFADGIQIWGTLIALEVDGELVVGMADAPALGERYAAARDAGARMNGEPVHVSRTDRVRHAFLLHAEVAEWLAGPHADALIELVSEARRERGFGDFWGHMLVARGSADVMLEPELAIWDFAALKVIVEEAGGRMTTFAGGPVEHGASVLTTNGQLHDEIVSRLRADGGASPRRGDST